MAKEINAIQAYSPRLVYNQITEINHLVELIEGRCGLNKSTIRMVLTELEYAIVFYLKMARPLRLEDIGLFRPTIDRDGTLRVKFKPEKALLNALNEGTFEERIKNDDMIGKSVQDYIARWNDEHPDNKIKAEK